MAITQLRLITLPNNVSTDGSCCLSVFISPILPTLPSLPAFLKRWPSVADSLEFQVDVQDASGVVQAASYRATPTGQYSDASPLESVADAQIGWQSVFEDSTVAVKPTPPPTVQSVLTTQVDVLHDAIRSFHASVANGTSLSTVGAGVHAFRGTLKELEAFHGKCGKSQAPLNSQEFHSRFVGLSQYFSVMRLLRLVIDFKVTGLQPSALPVGGSICAYVSGLDSSAPAEATALSDPNQVTLAYPWVRYAFDSKTQTFTTASGTERFGLAALGSSQYYSAELDVDAGGLGLLKHVARKDSWDSMTALPDRRGRGVQIFDLLNAGNIPILTQQVNDADAALAANTTPFASRPKSYIGVPPFDTTYLRRGYRIDVAKPVNPKDSTQDDSRSLCEREVTALGLPEPTARLEDAAVNAGLATAPDGAVDRKGHPLTWKSTQVFFRWTGWSLVVPRPRPKSDPPQPDHPIKASVIPRRLVPLRFGTTYKFRARATDIAGNGISRDQAWNLETNLGYSDVWREVEFLRQTVVPPPNITQQTGSIQKSTIVVATELGIPNQQTIFLSPPAADFTTLQLAGTFDALTEDGKIAQRQGYQGVKHFKDPSVSGIVASIGRSMVDSTGVGPKTINFLPIKGGSKEIQRLLVEGNRPVTLVCKAGKRLSLDVQTLGNRIVLNVPPGRIVEVLVRSLIAKDKLLELELYAVDIQKYLSYGPQYSSLAGPMRLIVVHAVSKPLLQPAFGVSDSGVPITVTRKLGTSAVGFVVPDIILDRESTGQIELEAEWEEVSDEVDAMGQWPTRYKVSANLASAAVALLQGHPWRPMGDKANVATGLTLQGVHDFGDGKFRHLSLALLATSRFARYFSTSSPSDPLGFSLKSSSVPIDIVASGAPPPPNTAYMVPTIGRSDMKSRRGMMHRNTETWGLRIYLERGWFSTGDGERLAIIVSTSSTDPNATSLMGADPALKDTPVAASLTPGDFRNGTYAKHILGTTNQETFDIVSFPVSLDKTKNLLCADVLFNARPNYRVFARLALARYQQHGQSLARLSTIRTADFIQLGPTRGLTIAEAGEMLRVTVTGPGTDDSVSPSLQSVLVAISETRGNAFEPWQEKERVTLSPKTPDQSMNFVWAGDIRRTGDNHNRIVVEEFEIAGDHQGAGKQSMNLVDIELIGKLIFSDSFEF